MGLNIGGDDYITKPFVISEVLARVRAVLRRSQASQQYAYNVSQALTEPDIVFKTLRIDRNEKACYLDGQPVALTKTNSRYCCFSSPTATEFTPARRLYARCGPTMW